MELIEMPKIDLHCHLDGSMQAESISKILTDLGEPYPVEELKKKLFVPETCESLAEYLQCFDLPIKCIQTKEGLMASAKELALLAAAENVKYLEVRFAPTFSTNNGMKVVEIIESVEAGLAKARSEADIETGIIVCAMRHLDMDTNLAMLKEARELYGAGVVACDLAGDEKAFPNSQYVEFFKKATEYGMPFTIHSGECGSTENIKTALELKAKRIGHGIAMGKDPELIKECAKAGIGVEICPTSNIQTKAIDKFANYPFPAMKEAGVKISVNTDNRTVSQTNSTKEFSRLLFQFGLNEDDLKKIYRDSVDMIFADDDCKDRLWKKW